jgi:hypothetical protein
LLTSSSTSSPLAMHRRPVDTLWKNKFALKDLPRFLGNLAKITKIFNRIITKFKWKIR